MARRPIPDEPSPDLDTQLSEAIGKRVRSYRIQLGYTIAQLAEHSGLSKGMLSKVENAQASPSLSTLARIATALDVPLTAFFDSFQVHTVLHVKRGHGLDIVPRGSRSGMRSQLLGQPARYPPPVGAHPLHAEPALQGLGKLPASGDRVPLHDRGSDGVRLWNRALHPRTR